MVNTNGCEPSMPGFESLYPPHLKNTPRESEAFILYYEKSSVIIVEYRFDCELFRLIAPSS